MSAENRIYVACLASYNSGTLHGVWIDVDGKSAGEVEEEVQAMLKESKEPGAEEWAIHDYEGFGGVKLSESESFENIAQLVEAIDEHGEIIAKYWDHVGGDLDTAIDGFKDNYQGAHRSIEEYAEQWFEDTLPDIIKHHIDWEGIGRDLEISGDIFTIEHDGDVHVFYNH